MDSHFISYDKLKYMLAMNKFLNFCLVEIPVVCICMWLGICLRYLTSTQ